MRRRLLFKLLNNCTVPGGGSQNSSFQLFLPSLAGLSYQSGGRVTLQSVAISPPASLPLFPLSGSLGAPRVSVSYQSDSEPWDRPFPGWSFPPFTLTLFWIFLFPIFSHPRLFALHNGQAFLHCSAWVILDQSQRGSVSGVEACTQCQRISGNAAQRQ